MAETIPSLGSDQLKEPHPVRSKNKVAACREGRAWTRLVYAGAAIGTLTLAVGLGVYDRLTAAGDGPNQGRTPDAPLRDPRAGTKRGGMNAPANNKERGLRLVQYKQEAEDALIWASFHERDGATDKLQECLEVLKRWKQEEIAIHGEPQFTHADGLVITRSPAETMEKDCWDRVTNAIQQLSRQLDKQP